MSIEVGHIANVSFTKHFLDKDGKAPVNGKIKVNDNIFDVTFANGKVNAKFASSNFFANWFRGKTMSRFVNNLQNQYNTWLNEQALAEEKRRAELAQTLGYKDNPDAGKVAAVVDEFKAILDEVNPAAKEKLVHCLDEIAKLAELRNTLTRIPSGTACNTAVTKAKFLTHFDDETKKMNETQKKGYVINTLDTIINGFLQAASQMTNKKVQVPSFIRDTIAGCIEAKADKIQTWLERAAGISNIAQSDSTKDLAYSVNAEFTILAEEIRKPYYEEARINCEAEVRANCAKKGITDEAEILDKIESKAAMIVADKEAEIAPKIRKYLIDYGKFKLYPVLVGAQRPVTEISKDPNTDKWTVTTLVDKNGEPILKTVSAFDIDSNYNKLVDMFMDDAIAMDEVEHKTVAEEPVYASRDDYRPDQVLAKADEYLNDKAKLAELAKLVKDNFCYETDLPDDQFQQKIEEVLKEITATKSEDPEQTKKAFKTYVVNFADASYFDKKDDFARLALIVKSRAEAMINLKETCLAKIDEVSFRCAQMMSNAFKDHKVYVVDLQRYLKVALKSIVTNAFNGKEGNKVTNIAKAMLKSLMGRGVFFTDNPLFDLANRAIGGLEIQLHDRFDILMKGLRLFANAPVNYYMKTARG